MLVDVFNMVSRRYGHLDGYLQFDKLREVMDIAVKHLPDIEVKAVPSIMVGQYDLHNEFTCRLFAYSAHLDQNDWGRLRSFTEIFSQNHTSGFKTAMEKAFDHFDTIATRHPEMVEKTRRLRAEGKLTAPYRFMN